MNSILIYFRIVLVLCFIRVMMQVHYLTKDRDKNGNREYVKTFNLGTDLFGLVVQIGWLIWVAYNLNVLK